MIKILLIGLGGGIGSVFRYLMQMAATRYLPLNFPFGTLVVNVTGCLIIGFLFAIFEKNANLLPIDLRLFLITGVCGGYTTFSTFSMDSILLFKEGQYTYFVVYVMVSVLLGIMSTATGYLLIRG